MSEGGGGPLRHTLRDITGKQLERFSENDPLCVTLVITELVYGA
jgi:hypothetical protein